MDSRAVLAVQDFHIRRVGWAVTAVYPNTPDDGAPFAYTIGLTEHGDGQPEFIIAGLHPLISHALLNDMAARTHRGDTFTHAQVITDLIDGYPAILIDGTPTDLLWPGAACARYHTTHIRLRQIVWPDPDSRFPWDPSYAYPEDIQPLIGRP
jgi:hypothetical protein